MTEHNDSPVQRTAAELRVIDFHTHVFPEDVAARALGGMIDRTHMRAFYDGTIGGLLAEMDRAGIDVSVLAPVATRPSQVASINDWTAERLSPRIRALGAMHPAFDDPVHEIERIAALGLSGIKLHPEFQAFHPEDERMGRVYEMCGRLGLTVLFHAGEDPNFETVSGEPEVFARLAERYPDTTFVLAHMGGYRMWDEAVRLLADAPVYLDTSHATEVFAPSELRDLIRAYGAERVLFASDGPWTDAAAALAAVRSCGLEASEIERVVWGNAASLLRIA
ncbi:MAG: amidohydrolase family protein [Anaerosomatales bacterium]|nr:amidohydrolase family protein [Anaerosomatales bacterium]